VGRPPLQGQAERVHDLRPGHYSCEPEEKTIPYVVQWIGEDNIVYASDYPHWDSEWPHTVDELLKRGDLGPGLKAKILGQNALAFYGITVGA